MSEHCCGNERLKCVENRRCRAGLLFAVTLAASASSLAPMRVPSYCIQSTVFPFFQKFFNYFSGDAGTEPKSRYFMAQCKKALGDEAGYKAELENSLKGWIHAGEMDYWRVKALRELGRDAECAPLIAELKQAIKELETPQPVVINAYAKFAGDNSAMERAAKAREKAGSLRELLEEIEK